MRLFLSMLIVCLLVSCSKKHDTPNLLSDDTFFNGFIGHDFFDIKNEFREDKAIRTVQESPTYNFIFSYTFDNRPNQTEVYTTILNVNIPDPKEGEKYLITTEVSARDLSRAGIICDLRKNTFNPDETQSKTYIAAGLMKPVQVLVNKVDVNTYRNSKTITGQIRGFLYNKLNLQDSIEINAEFKTKLYK